MNRQTRGWMAVVRPGAVPKLFVRGEVCTHPYAQAFLKEGRSPKDQPDTLCLRLTVLADTPRADLKEWTGVSFEKSLLARSYGRVVIAGLDEPVELDIKHPAGT